jgi:hypothetical protein
MSLARIYRVGTAYNGSELSDIDFEQSERDMTIVHIDHPVTNITRSGHVNWTVSAVTFGPKIAAPATLAAVATDPNQDIPNSGAAFFPQPARYVATAIDDDTGEESRASSEASATNDLTLKKNYNTLTIGAVAGAERYALYKAENSGAFGYIGTTTQLTFRDDNIQPDYSRGPPRAENPFSSAGNYPSTVTYFEQRLFLARTKNRPNAVWASQSGASQNMDTSLPLRPSDALAFALRAGRVNAVNQLVSMSSLMALTSDSLFKIEGAQGGTLSGSDVPNARRENGRGSSRLGPLIVDSVAFYQSAIDGTIRTIGYQFQTDSVESNDITIWSPHFFRNRRVVRWAFAQSPNSIIVAVMSDGKALCFTWERDQELWGWTEWETDGLFEDVSSISEQGEDRLYFLVRRDERMAAAEWINVEDCCFVDSARSYVFDTPTAQLNNLEHLNGRTVKALVDGSAVSGLVVENGKLILSNGCSKATVGIPYGADIETLPLAVQAGNGWTVAKPQTQGKVNIHLLNSRGVKAGPNRNSMEALRNVSTHTIGEVNSLLNGVYETNLRPEINGGAHVVIQQDDPLPLTVLAIYIDPTISR